MHTSTRISPLFSLFRQILVRPLQKLNWQQTFTIITGELSIEIYGTKQTDFPLLIKWEHQVRNLAAYSDFSGYYMSLLPWYSACSVSYFHHFLCPHYTLISALRMYTPSTRIFPFIPTSSKSFLSFKCPS
jgi:hypothetical protein